MVLEIGQPPPSGGDIALTLTAGACVSLKGKRPWLSPPWCRCRHGEVRLVVLGWRVVALGECQGRWV